MAARIDSFFGDPESLQERGNHYLESAPSRIHAADILPPGVSRREFSAASGQEVRELIGRRVTEDHSAGRITAVEGWMLSDTEMTISALLTLHRR